MLEFLSRQQVLTEFVAEVNVDLLKSTLSMHEVAEMEIDKLLFGVMFTELIAEILQKIGLELVLVEEIIPFINLPTRTCGNGWLRLFRSLPR